MKARESSAGAEAARYAKRGFTAVELLVVTAVLGILALASAPALVTYLQSARVQGAAETLAAFVNRGRHIAIAGNQLVCIQNTETTLIYRTAAAGGNACSGTPWTGAGTSSSGVESLPEGIALVSSASPVFNSLGSATPAATYTLREVASGRTRTVTVAASGRVRIP